MRLTRHRNRRTDRREGFFARLLRDRRANTLAIMAVALVPLAGMLGGGLDLARMYLVKTRMQHACDAGALAGRKSMGGGQWSQSSYRPRTTAERFFTANFENDAYGSRDTQRTFTEQAGKVTGKASAKVPMTLTRIMGFTEETIAVTCEAEMRLPNTDVMFVLDVTGSMGDRAVSSDTQTKIQALRSAVKCFYEIVQKLDTDENCVGGPPSGGLSDQVQVRFGFVPYSSNVNVGRLLPQNFLADNWTYQSREVEDDSTFGVFNGFSDTSVTNTGAYGGFTTDRTMLTNRDADCNVGAFGVATDNYTPTLAARGWPIENSYDGTNWRALTPVTHRQYSTTYTSSTRVCTLRYRERSATRNAWHRRANRTDENAVAFPIWVYRPVRHNIAALKNSPNMAQVSLPIGVSGSWVNVPWNGCIEERQTVRAMNYDPIPAGALDLDVESSPTGDETTQWAPLLPSAIFARRNADGQLTRDEVRTFNHLWGSNQSGRVTVTCPAAARKLEVMDDPGLFDNYVDSLVPDGNTYHDIGLIWGARLMWPTGIFRSENEFTPRGGEIQRHLIFMTDGEAFTAGNNYQAYGYSPLDRRQTDPNVMPSDAMLTQQVNLRTQALCKRIRNENITLWVIWFGQNNRSIEGLMTSCATQGRFFAARNSADLQNTFRQIADQISQLRITQ